MTAERMSPFWGNGCALPHPGPLPLGEGEPSAALGREEAFGLAKRGRTGSLSQRERVGVRENGLNLPTRMQETEMRPPSSG